MVFTLSVIIVLISLSYLVLIASYVYGWQKLPNKKYDTINTYTPVTIIVPARNEEHSIKHVLQKLVLQDYPANKFEVIVVDDASEDNTAEIVKHFCENYSNVKLLSISKTAENKGKKNAIDTAIKQATGELIITTDADCSMGINWLQTMVSYFHQTGAKMIIGPVAYHNENSTFNKMQSLDFMALTTSGAASLYFNKAIMCNGANLAYSKQVYDEVNGFENIKQTASGDDVLLMYKIKQKHPIGVAFVKDKDAIVYTEAQPTFNAFINQRKRWASKPWNLLNPETKTVSAIVFLFNALIFIMGLMACINLMVGTSKLPFVEICLILLVFKCFIDFLLLFLAASFFGKKDILIYFLPVELLYPIYIVYTAIGGLVGGFTWKKRRYKH